ncbi:MAG: beta-ketoacyl synthase chain length factor, partial [Deltaproteobacteria bacterium]|nr:beta-ketoacyl synthase chain length factor [Deltaproteobacteria bacterium]
TIAGAGLAHSVGGLAQLTDGRGISASSASADTAELAADLPGVSLRRIPHYARMALLAAVRALDDAGWRQASDLRDVALVMGTAYGSPQMSMDFMDSILDGGPRLSSPTAFSHAVNNMGGGLLSLLLDLQGPCLTVSQFDLSFAGAAFVATTMLRAGRARRVLVGVVDEMDGRFARCCPQTQKAGIAQTEGAVFLCLEPPDPKRIQMSVRWGQNGDARHPAFVSGSALPIGDDSRRNELLYGHGPSAQALDVLLALNAIRNGTARRIDCACVAASSQRSAVIEIRESSP